MATYKTNRGSFNYSGNPDFRGYLAANASEFLPYVGAGPSGNTYQDYGINMKALNKAGGLNSNYAQQSLTPAGVRSTINKLYSQYAGIMGGTPIETSASAGGGGGYGYGGYGASNPLAETYAGQRNDTRNRLQAAINAYNSLAGVAQTAYADQANKLRTSYQGQRDKLKNTLETTANNLTSAYQARGLGDSSFAANAQNSALNNYNTDLTNVQNNENQSISDLGSKLQTARAQYEAAKSGYQDFLNRIGTFGGSELGSIMNQAQLGMQNAAQAQAGMGTQSENIAAITGVAPKQLDTSQLQSQLQSIQNSGTSDFAKNAIARGMIKQATAGNPDQETYWTDYYNKLSTTGKA